MMRAFIALAFMGSLALTGISPARFVLPEEPAARIGAGCITGNIAFSPDGTILAVPTGIGIRLYKGDNLERMALLEGHEEKVLSAAFSPDGKLLASGDWDGVILIWDVVRRRKVAKLTGHSFDVFALAFSPDGRLLASGSRDQTARIWSLKGMKEVERFSFKASVGSVAFSPDGRFLAIGVGFNNTVHLRDVRSGKEVKAFEGAGDNAVVFSPDGKLLICSGWGFITIWDVREGRMLAALRGHRDGVTSLSINRDGTLLASGGDDGAALLWEMWPGSMATIDVRPEGMMPALLGRIKGGLLRQNYPNPFNSGTWIPYRLFEPSRVEIRIFTLSGRLVRRLNLGLKPAGDHVAYWDGRDESGEPVSSGIYIYELRGEGFSEARRMMTVK